MVPPPLSHRRQQRGFTLAELMVAVTGGLLVSVAVFALARDTTRFYQREARVGEAMSQVLIGFQRLQTDVGRTGYLSSPNLARDPRLCLVPGNNPSTWPFSGRLAAVRVGATPGLPTLLTSAPNNRAPQRLDLAGSYAADAEFPIWGVTGDAGSGYRLELQVRMGPLARMGYRTSSDQAALLGSIFANGRLVRIVDLSGSHFYGAVAGVNTTGGAAAVLLAPAPPLRLRTTTASNCGLEGTDLGTASVVSFIRYELRTATALSAIPSLSSLYADGFPADRTDLVRVERAADGTELSAEVVAEYAVDLRVGVTAINTMTADGSGSNAKPDTPVMATAMTNVAPDGDSSAWTGDPWPPTNALPDRVRSLRIRFSVRSRAADRGGPVVANTEVAAGFYRMELGTNEWARVRTLQGDIALRNLEDILWPR